MPTAPDGILEATYDPSRNIVMLAVEGDAWPDEVAYLSITRSAPGVATEPVWDLGYRAVSSGWFFGSDNIAPMDTIVTYAATGYDAAGSEVATSTVAVPTSGAAWGVWLKAAGRGDLTAHAPLREISEVVRDTLGGVYQVPAGPAIPQSSGQTALRASISLLAQTAGQASAVEGLLSQVQDVLVQTGQPEELPSGWYHVDSVSRANPGQVRSDVWAGRVYTLALTATLPPVGTGIVYTGVTYASVVQTYATYQDILDEVASYADLQRGA